MLGYRVVPSTPVADAGSPVEGGRFEPAGDAARDPRGEAPGAGPVAHRRARAVGRRPLATVFALMTAAALAACPAPDREGAGAEGAEPPGSAAPAGEVESAVRAMAVGTDEDWRIVREKLTWIHDQGLTGRPVGEIVAALAPTFVGTTYTPHTLEVGGPERLVINLRELDCVTFVENVLAISFLAVEHPVEILANEAAMKDAYRRTLQGLRYRGGIIDGYPSRLHYFSEWIADNEVKGRVRDVTSELGGRSDPEAIDFMSTHPDAYRQLADRRVFEAIQATETRLSGTPRAFIPEDEIEARSGGIRSGDVIAATSTVPGLDVAHTGIAVWIDGTLRLVHAPLVGSAVEVSESSLAERILRIPGQDGIMVARPVDPREPLGEEATNGSRGGLD